MNDITMDGAFCGLRISSDLNIPDLSAWRFGSREPDVRIRLSQAEPEEFVLGARPTSALTFELAGGGWLLRVPGIGSFLVQAGREITVVPAGAARQEDLAEFLVGPVLAVLCYQRGLLPLRATVMGYGEAGVAICGETGSGKSSTGYALFRGGMCLLSDGLSILQSGGETALATHRGFRLWRAATDSLHISSDALSPTRALLPKLKTRVDPSAFDALGRLPLAHIVFLSPRGRNSTPHEALELRALTRRIRNQLYLYNLPVPANESHSIEGICARLALNTRVHIYRGVGGARAAQAILRAVAA